MGDQHPVERVVVDRRQLFGKYVTFERQVSAFYADPACDFLERGSVSGAVALPLDPPFSGRNDANDQAFGLFECRERIG
jgi:hypothetical protein